MKNQKSVYLVLIMVIIVAGIVFLPTLLTTLSNLPDAIHGAAIDGALPGQVTQSASRSSGETRLVFLGNHNIPPVVYLDSGQPTGVAVSLVEALAGQLSQPVEIRAMDWAEAQKMVANGEADALIQINITDERKKLYDFSDPFLESHFSIFTRANAAGISGISGLRGLSVGVEKGGLPQQLLEKEPQIRLTIIPSFLEGFQQLNDGTIDAVVVDYRVGSYVLAQNSIRNIKITGGPIQSSYSAIAVKKGNTKLLAEINHALRTMKADGTYQKILSQWQPTEVVFETQQQINEKIFLTTAAILLAALALAGFWIVNTRRQLKQRQIAEDKLQKQYSTLVSIINSANALIFSVDRDYRYTSFNRGHAATMKALYGVEIELGKNLLDLMTVAEDREQARRNLDRALAGEQLVEEAYSGEELRSRLFFQVSHSPIKTETGEIIGVAVLSQDITSRKRIEEEVHGLNQDLEQRVREHITQLEAVNAELDAFAYTVSHDLRAPLRHVSGFIKLLQQYNTGQLDEKSEHYMAVITEAASRMERMIEDLLSFSRMARTEMFKGHIDLKTLVEDVITELKPETEGREVQWQIGSLPQVTGDRAMLRIVLVNLVSNALKFTRSKAPAKIEIGSLPDCHQQVVVFVRDNGVGFDMQYAGKLFGVFQRLHRAEDFEGTGIGLANVRRIVKRHGGEAWAEGEIDHGATFYISFPVLAAH